MFSPVATLAAPAEARELERAASFLDGLVNYLSLPAALVAPTVGEQPLAITAPIGEAVWLRNSKQKIAWRPAPVPATALLSIYLISADNSKITRILTLKTPNDGAEEIAVPASLRPGKYRLRLTAKVDNKNYEALSAGVITVVAKTGITLVSPNGGALLAGAALTVAWRTDNIPKEKRVIFQFVAPGQELAPLTFANSLNDGKEFVTIPAGIAPGQYWLEAVTSSAGAIYTDRSDRMITVKR